MDVITPSEFIHMQSPVVDKILERINSHMTSTGDCHMNISLANLQCYDGIVATVKRKLISAGWIVDKCERNCDDRPCSEPYLEISLDIPRETNK